MAHEFQVKVRWKDGLSGEVTPEGLDDTVAFGVPKEFGGSGDRWTPEHFYAAAVNACIAATFFSIARQSKVELASYESSATATMEKTGEGLRITRVDVRPRIRVASDKDRERAERMIQKAEAFCPVSHSVTAPVHLEASVEGQA